LSKERAKEIAGQAIHFPHEASRCGRDRTFLRSATHFFAKLGNHYALVERLPLEPRRR